jgi:hypothetical protein
LSEHFNSAVTPHPYVLGLSYEVIEIPPDPEKKPIRSLEEILASQCRNPGQIVRSPVTPRIPALKSNPLFGFMPPSVRLTMSMGLHPAAWNEPGIVYQSG